MALAIVTLALGGTGYAEEIFRDNWVPNTHSENLGDVWTFKCPAGGHVNVTVQTAEDNVALDLSTIDPVLEILDGTAAVLAFFDDDIECRTPQACGFSCPQARDVPCGKGTHSIVIAHSGDSRGDNSDKCQIGGGYTLSVEVFDANGISQPASKVKLGGGPQPKVPNAVRGPGAPSGPAVDDGPIAFHSQPALSHDPATIVSQEPRLPGHKR
jgi:hypothetical protein